MYDSFKCCSTFVLHNIHYTLYYCFSLLLVLSKWFNRTFHVYSALYIIVTITITTITKDKENVSVLGCTPLGQWSCSQNTLVKMWIAKI